MSAAINCHGDIFPQLDASWLARMWELAKACALLKYFNLAMVLKLRLPTIDPDTNGTTIPTDMYRTPPILFLVFNRPELAERVFIEIRDAKPAQLFIAADGPRAGLEDEVDLCRRCRSLVDRVDWPCEVKTLFRSENLGCMRAVSEAITWFFTHVENGIILEDDCLPHPSFFPYCSLLLNEYRHEHRVLSIGGSSLGFTNLRQSSYGFTSFMSMWGWASWADRAQEIDYSLRSWGTWRSKLRLLRRLQRGREKFFDVDYSWYRHWSKSEIRGQRFLGQRRPSRP